jgi:predicted metalloprotease with PDZ domain
MFNKFVIVSVLHILISCQFVQGHPLKNFSDQNNLGAVKYTLEVEKERPDYFRIQIELRNMLSDTVMVSMPRWSPGVYQIREYAENVRDFKAYDGARRPLKVEKNEKNSWQIISDGRLARIEYGVIPLVETWAGAFDSTYVLVEGPATFMMVNARRGAAVVVDYNLPDGWEMVSPLHTTEIAHQYYADSYDTFIDAPAQLGIFDKYTFQIEDTPFELVFHGESDFAIDSFLVMVKRICDYHISFFDEIPFDRYVFFYKILPGRFSGGGLEHLNSTTIGLSGARLNKSILSAAEVTAHEFFHVWNVKRIFPKVLATVDYNREARTEYLWFAEGVTSYYEALTMIRAGLWDSTDFFKEIESQIERLQETRPRKTVSVAMASWSAWEHGYRYPNVSYYNKGQLLGLLLDLEIRQRTANRYSLDTVVKFMNWWFAREGVGYEQGDINRAINAITGIDFSDFFAKYVRGTDELPYEEVFEYAGLDFSSGTQWKPTIGAIFFIDSDHRIVSIEKNCAASKAGLRKKDRLLSINDMDPGSNSRFFNIINAQKIGSVLKLKVQRDGKELMIPVRVERKEDFECKINTLQSPSGWQSSIRAGWLEGWTTMSTPVNESRR